VESAPNIDLITFEGDESVTTGGVDSAAGGMVESTTAGAADSAAGSVGGVVESTWPTAGRARAINAVNKIRNERFIFSTVVIESSGGVRCRRG
jgi:hypothetical protein